MSTSTYIYIIGDSEANLWGLSGRERLQRTINACKHTILVDDIGKIPDQSPALLLCANYLFDGRVLIAMINMQENMALYSDDVPVAIRVEGRKVPGMLPGLLPDGNDLFISTLPRHTVKDMELDSHLYLKKKDLPYVLPIDKVNRKVLEAEIFAGSYKGVTDLVTKWLWPAPAAWATHLCVRRGWQPNHVTLLSLVLAVLTGVAFLYGYYGIGLLMGWMMTFLDTVDGKLARVTVTSSRLGDVLDHGLDLIHPPFWYWAWGIGLATTLTPLGDISWLVWLMFLGYIGGRLCEGAFQLWLAPFGMFIWRQLDSFNRLITARRNPNLILLTCGWLIGRPDIGFILVVVWHLVSTVILGRILYTAWRTWQKQGPLTSWLADIDPGRDREILAVRVFTRAPFKL